MARKFCDKVGAILVEDAAHVLMPFNSVGKYGDFVCYSPHKLLPIPDGAVLLQRSSTKAMKQLCKLCGGTNIRDIARSLPPKQSKTLRWLIKELLKIVLPERVVSFRLRIMPTSFDEDYIRMIDTEASQQSRLSRLLLSIHIRNLNKYAVERRINCSIVNASLCPANAEPVFGHSDSEAVPYQALIRFSSKEIASGVYIKCRRAGIPVQTWPDLPVEVRSNVGQHSCAVKLRNTTVAFPVHQGLGVHSMEKICKTASEPSSKIFNTSYSIEWFKDGPREWNEYMMKAGRSHLTQSWCYGETKRVQEGWNVNRGVVRDDRRDIGVFQALEKRIGPLSVVRINRGPLILVDDLGLFEKRNLYASLRGIWSARRGKLLLISPDLEETPQNLAAIMLSRYHVRSNIEWTSSWIDLSLPCSTIRKQLRGNWRNQLNVAERNGLSLLVDVTDDAFTWMMNRYEQSMLKKGYQGTTVKFLSEFRRQVGIAGRPEDVVVFSAEDKENEKVAGVLIACHGSACTYWVGWSSEKGRKLNANNFLLWNVILEMKDRGYKWFDLGGIDQKSTPTISSFKRGMSGAEYTLIGEWWG